MKKLKNKIFWTLFTILTLFSFSVLFIFNYQNYSREKLNIERNLLQINKEPFNKNFKDEIPAKEDIDFANRFNEEKNPKKFIDATIYTVLLNKDNSILEILSHTEDGTINENIEEYAKKIINENKNNSTYIGSLYFSKYSYNYEIDRQITIYDNTDIQERLIYTLQISSLIFILIEIVIVIISKILSLWIIKPVEVSFNKQKQFIADASHELKTPLSVIMASADALKEYPKEQKWLDTICSESDRMSKLITNLLDLAKVENDKKIYEEVNLSKVIEMSILTLESLVYEKNIKLEYNIDENIMYKCNSEEMKELISILMDNAIKHSSKKGKINIELKLEKNNIILKVKNKGNPLPKGEEEKIFERFYRTDKSRNRNENRYGLGLAIAKSIVLNHNGNISAHSDNDFTTFTVILKK